MAKKVQQRVCVCAWRKQGWYADLAFVVAADIYIYQKHTGIDSVTGWSGADGLDWYSFNRTISSSKARWERWITAVSKTFVYWIKGWRRRVLHCVLGVVASIIA